MNGQFPLFHSLIDLAHHFWNFLIQPGDCAIDATCGNGCDTLYFAGICERVISLDIQKEALERAKKRLEEHRVKGVTLLQMSHETLPASDFSIRLIVYNLGYLPGGNKGLTTLEETTLQSVRSALERVIPGGLVSITCYPGHAEEAKEERGLLLLVENLEKGKYCASHHRFANRKNSPSLILIQKTSC